MRKKLLVLLALLIMCMPMTALADEADNGTYQDVLASSLSKFFIKAQPNDAIVLELETFMDKTDLGQAEDGVYFNLPRLQNQYYYKVGKEEKESGWYIDSKLLYPSLSLEKGKTSPAMTVVPLEIWSVTGEVATAQCKITIVDQLQGTERQAPATYTDIKSGLTADKTQVIISPSGYMNAYNPALHKSALVTQGACYVFDPSFNSWVNASVSYNASTGEVGANDTSILDINAYINKDAFKTSEYKTYGASPGNISLQVKPYCLSSAGGLMVMDSEKYDANKGILYFGAPAAESYMLVSDKYCIFHERNSSGEDKNVEFAVTAGQAYTYEDLTGGHLAQLPTEYFTFYNSTGRYTALKDDKDFTITLYAPGLTTLNIKANITGKKSGEKPDPVPVPDEPTTYTLRFDYVGGLSSSFMEVTPGVKPTLPTPTKTNFDFKGWFVDQALTKEYDPENFAYVLGATYNLYSKWEEVGSYNVRFYDDKNNTDRTVSYRVDVKPELPDNPKYTGYQFKNWSIVDNTAALTGTKYDPGTFAPKNGESYIFKAMWDVSGVILSVTNQQREYWVGDTIDKSKLVVLVQTDSAGSTKTLSVADFSIDPEKCEKVGTTQVTLKYNQTGATATFEINGTADYLTGISASYSGDDITVGETIPKGNVKCKLTYKSTKVEETTDFTLSPSTAKAAGTNTITVTSSGFSTTITVTGKKKTDSSSDNSKTLSSISATYSGSQLYVGDSIDAGSIKVTAKYKDGSTETISSTAFNYSPNFVRNAGTNQIKVSYKDKECNLNITGLEKSTMNNDSSSSSSPTTTNRNDSSYVNDNGYNYNNTSSSSNRNNSTSNNGSTSSGNNTDGGMIVTGYKEGDKGTSLGYLKGKNILDELGRTTPGVSMSNDVDIMAEIREAGETATSVDITLINSALGNILSEDMVSELHSKGLELNVTMVSPQDKTSRVGYWTFDGKNIDSISAPIDLNIEFDLIDKRAETMYKVSVCDTEFPVSSTCRVTMRDAYTAGTFVNLYSTDMFQANSKFVQNLLWNGLSEVSLPIQDASYFVLTDYVSKYPDGSDLTEGMEIEATETETSEVVDTELSDEGDEYGDDFWGDDTSDDKEEKPSKKLPKLSLGKISAKGIILAGVGVGSVALIAIIIFILLSMRKNKKSSVEGDEDIPIYEGDDDEIVMDEEQEPGDDEIDFDEGSEFYDDTE